MPQAGRRGTVRPVHLLTRLQVHGDVLRLEELLEALVAALAAYSALLHASEGGAGVRDHSLVEAHHSGLEALADADRPLYVPGEDVGDEAVLGVVRAGDRVLLRFEAAHGRHRAEDLLVED